MAYSFVDAESAACTNSPVYAKVIEIIDNANWYDGVTALAISGGDFALSAANSPLQLYVYAIRPAEAPFLVDPADLTFVSGTVGACTVGANTGIVTRVAGGTSLITVEITAVPTIDASATATVT